MPLPEREYFTKYYARRRKVEDQKLDENDALDDFSAHVARIYHDLQRVIREKNVSGFQEVLGRALAFEKQCCYSFPTPIFATHDADGRNLFHMIAKYNFVYGAKKFLNIKYCYPDRQDVVINDVAVDLHSHIQSNIDKMLSTQGLTPLMVACMDPVNVEIVKLIAERCSLQQLSLHLPDFRTALYVASRDESPENLAAVKILLAEYEKRGKAEYEKDPASYPGIMSMEEAGKEAIRAAINFMGEGKYFSAFQRAAKGGCVANFQCLLEQGGDLYGACVDGYVHPLVLAAINGQEKVVKTILDHISSERQPNNKLIAQGVESVFNHAQLVNSKYGRSLKWDDIVKQRNENYNSPQVRCRNMLRDTMRDIDRKLKLQELDELMTHAARVGSPRIVGSHVARLAEQSGLTTSVANVPST
jgi:hypothetical protein